jgi:hypothetical protein
VKLAGLLHITMITGDGACAISLGCIAIGNAFWLPLQTDDSAQRLATCDVSGYTAEAR